jgi:hypothetical protein
MEALGIRCSSIYLHLKMEVVGLMPPTTQTYYSYFYLYTSDSTPALTFCAIVCSITIGFNSILRLMKHQ